jgi:O-antigen/teichoic acid export membrane protein
MISLLSDALGRFKKSPFIKNTVVVMSGTAFAQVLGFVLSPVISRLFSPSDFGVFGAFNAVISIIVSVVTLEYGHAIMLPREDEDAINLLAFSFLCVGLTGLLCILASVAVPTVVNGLMKTGGVWPLVLLVSATLAEGINQLTQVWAIRAKAFKQTSASQVVRGISSNGTKIGLGFLRAGALGLMIGNVLGGILASVNLIGVLLPDLAAFRKRIRWDRMKRLAREYRDFPMYSGSQNFINALSSGLPVLLFNRYYGVAVAGALAFASSALSAPMNFLIIALRQVLYQKACESQNQGRKISSLYVKTTLGLFALILLPAIALVIWAPSLFRWVFGPQWQLAGELARSLIIWLAVSFCNLPAVLFAKVIRIQRFVLFFDIAQLVVRVLILVLGGQYLTVLQTVMLFALAGAFMNGYLIFHVGRVVMKREGSAGWGNWAETLMKG